MFINVFTSHMNLRNSTGNSPNYVWFLVSVFFPSPQSMGFLVGIFCFDIEVDVLLPYTTKVTHHHHQPTTNHTTPSPTIPTTKPLQYSTLTAQNNLGELFALLKFLWPDVMAKESEVWQGNNNSAEVYRCCG